MANPKHVEILNQGVEVWNKWREKHSDLTPDLSNANFSNSNLASANLSRADLRDANLSNVSLSYAHLGKADLRRVDLTGTHLNYADFNHANLRKANLSGADGMDVTFFQADLSNAILVKAVLGLADFGKANLCYANLTGADLTMAILSLADLSNSIIVSTDLSCSHLVKTNLSEAVISDCIVYGVSAWDIEIGCIKKQQNLRVTPNDQPAVYVDNLEVAQFVYLLLNNDKIRSVIDTIGEKGVLILGRFTPERKAVLDAIRDKLRELGFVPMMFDFEKPTQRDFTETINTLAGMSRFIIADITKPKSAPLEFQAIVPDYMIPLVPIIQHGEDPFSMFVDLQNKYEWVLDVREYPDSDILIDKMESAIVRPALEKSGDMLMKRASGIRKKQIEEWQ